VILLLNGSFGIGKTTVARLLVKRMPRAVLFNPEIIGSALQLFRPVYDFQDLPSWRRMTIACLRATRLVWPNVVVPMAFSNLEYLDEIRRGIERFEPDVVHVCLVAPVEVVHARIRRRGDTDEWPYRRASECCVVHQGDEFATHVDAVRAPEVIAEELLTA